MIDQLRAFIRTNAALADQSSREWDGADGKQQAAYRAGMWWAFRQVELFIGSTTSDNETGTPGTRTEGMIRESGGEWRHATENEKKREELSKAATQRWDSVLEKFEASVQDLIERGDNDKQRLDALLCDELALRLSETDSLLQTYAPHSSTQFKFNGEALTKYNSTKGNEG